MDNKQIRELMQAMERTGTTHLSLKEKDFELTLERPEPMNGNVSLIDNLGDFRGDYPYLRDQAPPRIDIPAALTPPTVAIKQEDLPGTYVTSPMVGTYYSAPQSDQPSFVKVGQKVDKSTVVCIIEAMKVMNEIKSGVDGTIAEILIENGHPVEFGSKLFRIV